MENQFSRVRSAKDIIISVSLIVSGFVLMFLPYGTGMNIGGFFLFLVGALFLMLFKSHYKELETNDVYEKKVLYFPQESINAILKSVISNPNSIDISKEGQGKTVKLNIYYSYKADNAYLRLYEYIPYSYEPITEVKHYSIKEVSNLIK